MSLGDGIFWGAVVASMVALFLGTKDRWCWQRIDLLMVGGLLGVAAMAGLGVYGHTISQERPQVITAHAGNLLGAPSSDAVFLNEQRKENTSEKGWFYKVENLGVSVEFDALYVPRTRARPSPKPRTVYVMMIKINMD